MRDAHCGVGGVHALSAFTRGTVDVHADVFIVNFHGLHLVRLWIDQHTGRRGLDTTLRFRDGHTLHAMHSTLELEHTPSTITGRLLGPDRQGHILDSTQVRFGQSKDFRGKAMLFRIPLIHAGKFTGKQCRLFPAGTRFDLHDNVITVVRVARCQQISKLFFQLHGFLGKAFCLRRELGVLVGHFLRSL